MSRHVCALTCAFLFLAVPAHAEPLQLDLASARARARARAPEAIAVLARLGEAEATRVGARVRFTENPHIAGGVGPRIGGGMPMMPQVEARITQQLEPSRRRARIDVAEATVDAARASTVAELRALDLAVSAAFAEARHAELVVDVARKSRDIATRAEVAAARRRAAGELTDLEVDLVRIALGRATAAVAAAMTARAETIGRLAVLVGAAPEDDLVVVGDLRPAPLTLEALRAAAPERPDVRALEAAARLASAEYRQAEAAGRPDFGLWAGYELDQNQHVFVGGFAMTIPMWHRADGEKAVAAAKQRRVAAERAATVGAARREVVDAFAVYAAARDAVDAFDRDVAPYLANSERLLDRSIETGQIAVATYLAARLEILNGHREQLDRQLALAKAAASARAAAGVAP